MKGPLVSFIILTYNRPFLLARALRSALLQTYSNLEIIIYDDGSPPNTYVFLEGLHDSRIRYLRSKVNNGECIARNLAIANASGKYICWMDDDDLSNIYRVESQVKVMEKLHPSFLRTAAVVYGKKTEADWQERPKIAGKLRFMTATTMAETEKMRAVGYDPAVLFGCDVLWELHMTRRFGTGMIIPYILYYRDLGPDDRVSKKYNVDRPDYKALMKYQLFEKARLLKELASEGIKRWPSQIPEKMERQLSKRLG